MLPALYRVSSASRPVSIVLAEDHAELRELLARELETEGVLVDSVADGESAIARALDPRFPTDAVVTDIQMPRKTGIDVLRTLRTSGLATPVILLTAFVEDVDRDEIERFGGAVLLQKPFDFDDLRTALRNLHTIARLRRR